MGGVISSQEMLKSPPLLSNNDEIKEHNKPRFQDERRGKEITVNTLLYCSKLSLLELKSRTLSLHMLLHI